MSNPKEIEKLPLWFKAELEEFRRLQRLAKKEAEDTEKLIRAMERFKSAI